MIEGIQQDNKTIDWVGSIPFFAVHLMCLFVFWVEFSWTALAICLALVYIRLFGITAGYHRYFSHRSFKTSRWFQFVLAVLGNSAAQMGPLWWAAHHRKHHRYSDKDEDVHSPGIHGLFWSHVGWILCAKNMPTDEKVVRDLATYPELRFINRYHVLAPTLLGVFVFYFGVFLNSAWPSLGVTGFQLLIWGFFVSTVILYHLTFSINSLAHVFGSRRFDTPDKSRNNAILGLLLMGEGWHNNHHRYPGAESQGIFWWEIDITHYILKGLSFWGVVWDLRKQPETVYTAAK